MWILIEWINLLATLNHFKEIYESHKREVLYNTLSLV